MDTEAQIRPPIGHLFAATSEESVTGSLYDYVVGGNGVFLQAQRAEFSFCLPIAKCDIRGLPEIEERFVWNLPRVPLSVVEAMLRPARAQALEDREILFHLLPGCGSPLKLGWLMEIPQQEQGRASCRPLDSGPDSSHARALIEIHSHHNMPAFFSSTDDADEQGFRIYGVLGQVLEAPEIRIRVGCHGYHFDIPAHWVMHLPCGLKDLTEAE